ncbi:hypothetical protein BDB01DRAFT_810266 [Pilobolus umbonatus]|nr:hypothetical protein BDB01DRAFT_810266 [Pilobolus umbonatus]
MHSIPDKLLILITSNLNEQDLFQCLIVNKLWYSVCIQVIYKAIQIIPNSKSNVKFINCFINYSRTQDALYHIEMLGIDLSDGNMDDDTLDMLHLLVKCPKVRIMSLPLMTHLVKNLLTSEDGTLSNVENFYIEEEAVSRPELYLNLLIKHKYTLKTLQLHKQDYGNVMKYHIGFPFFLSLFPHLTDLQMYFDYCDKELLEDVLDQCPNLKSLSTTNTNGFELNLETKDHLVPHSIKSLLIATSLLSSNNVRAFAQKFPFLHSLNLKVVSMTHPWLFVDAVMTLKELKSLLLNFETMDEQDGKNIMDTFYEYVQPLDSNTMEITPRSRKSCSMGIQMTKDTHMKWTNVSVKCNDTYPLEKHGHLLNQLQLNNLSPAHLEMIRSLCPQLRGISMCSVAQKR